MVTLVLFRITSRYNGAEQTTDKMAESDCDSRLSRAGLLQQ